MKAREALRGEVATLAVKGAEQILKREVDQTAHAQLLNQLKAGLIMAELATIARPYAEALFRVAEGGDIAAWSRSCKSWPRLRVCRKSCRSRRLKVTRTQVAELLLAAVKSPLGAGAEAKNFVQMLVDNHRIALLPEIAEQFEALRTNVKVQPTPRS